MNRFYFIIQISPNPSLLKRGIRANTFTVSLASHASGEDESSLPKNNAQVVLGLSQQHYPQPPPFSKGRNRLLPKATLAHPCAMEG